MSDLRDWQREALVAWEANGRRGIVAAATGTGKTRLAIEVLRRAIAEKVRVVVVVPTRVLQDQWMRELRASRVVPVKRLGTIGGNNPTPSPDHLVTVAVIDSARTGARNLIRHWNSVGLSTLLVVDECHWAGSEHNRGVFAGDATWRLGLSATPERGDDGFDDILVPELGAVIYRYSLKAAMDDGVLADLRLLNLIVDLLRREIAEFEAIEARIESLVVKLQSRSPELFQYDDWTGAVAGAASADADAKRLNALVGERRRMLARSSGRLSVLKELFADGLLNGRRSIVFNETIDQAEQVAALARSAGSKVVVDHSRMLNRDREASHLGFRNGNADCLVVVRTADEGVDVPDADQAVIVSGTMNARQRIQRLGRVVRLGGAQPRAVSLLARGTPEERVVAGRDIELLGLARVRTVGTRDRASISTWL